MTQILKEKFPQATAIKVTDISGQVFSCLSQSLVGFCPSEGQRAGGLAEGMCHPQLLNMCGFWTHGTWPLPHGVEVGRQKHGRKAVGTSPGWEDSTLAGLGQVG